MHAHIVSSVFDVFSESGAHVLRKPTPGGVNVPGLRRKERNLNCIY